MSSIPRRLQKINFLEQDAENIVLSEDGLQGPPKIDNILPRIPHESTSQIKIIWPNGEMRQIVGVFRNKFLLTLNGGKIIVETDQNGVPNERSGSILSSYLTELAQNSTIAPLHIPRWDNEMFKPKQHEMIKHVEVKFVYPPETTQLTRDWILMTLAKKWRAYKSCLKKKYYNRDARTLDEILKDVPRGANEHQRLTLVGIWCQDSHMKICIKNSKCAKQQKNSHTTGRKGHARLLKEMEAEKNGKVSKIELWDWAHKRKDDNNDSDNNNTTMVDLLERDDDTNVQHESNTDIQESPHTMHISSNTFQELLPGKCTRVKEDYANSSFSQEDGLLRKHTWKFMLESIRIVYDMRRLLSSSCVLKIIAKAVMPIHL